MDFQFVRSSRKGMEGYGSLYARVRSNGKNKKYALGLTIKDNEWQKLKTMKYNSNNVVASLGIRYGQLQEMLYRIKVEFEENFKSETASDVIHTIIYSALNNVEVVAPSQTAETATTKKKKKSMLLRDYISEFISDLETGKRTKRRHSTKVSYGYIYSNKSTLSSLKEFESRIKRRIHLDDVTMTFQRNFVSFMRDKELAPNTINTRMGNLHTIMNNAYLEKKTTCIDFQNPEFVPSKEETDEIYLEPERIDALLALDLSSIEVVQGYVNETITDKKKLKELSDIDKRIVTSLNKTRDIFIVGCLTGQRISDYSRIGKEMLCKIDDNEFIKIKQKKTGATVLIPYDSRVDAILEKYDGQLPPISRVSFSKYLKLLGEFLGWTELVTFEGRGREHKKPQRFCDLITSHTARRSFATNAYAAGIPLASIMAVTGHSSEKNLRIYLRLDSKEKAIIAASDFKGFIQMN